jgi:hypothetical protein
MGFLRSLLSFQIFISVVLAQDTVWGVYIFHRHGDRTDKSHPPASLTVLGYDEVFGSGSYYHSRYVEASSPLYIQGLSSSTVKNSQVSVSAPLDTVLMNSAQGFLQGFYPPVTGLNQTLRNGSIVTAPLNGYQLIPITLSSSSSGNEDNGWLQDASGCSNADISSNNYFNSAEYKELFNSTQSFWTRLIPVVNQTFATSAVTFKNAYAGMLSQLR